MHKKILLVDDEEELKNLLSRFLNLEGYSITEADDLSDARKCLFNEEFPVVILDVQLPDGNGIEFIKEIKRNSPNTEVIVLTAYGTIQDGVKAIKEGAFDYITKGDEDNKILPIVNKAFEKALLKSRFDHLNKRVSGKYSFENILGSSAAIKKAVEIAKRVSLTDTPVLLLGETGTGKELFAQSIHNSSLRKDNPFVAINCSAIAKDILESELFGYKAGAFTGAFKNKKGLFEEAHLGTIFLDEIAEMDVNLQAKLLRVLENNTFIKAGDTKETSVDVRIIAATNRILEKEIEAGRFREDLYYRINGFKIEIPSLRERKEDISALAEFFVKHYAAKLSRGIISIDNLFMKAIYYYHFPGNIRELRNIIERAIILTEGNVLTLGSLPKELISSPQFPHISDTLDDIEKNHILKVLHANNGNKSKTAEVLGIGLTTLYRKLQSYGIE